MKRKTNTITVVSRLGPAVHTKLSHYGMMTELVHNACRPSELTNRDLEAAIERLRKRDPKLADEAEHVVDALTWGEGIGVLRQAGLQEWLWYVVPTKYAIVEDGYMGELAESGAVLFDELGLCGYAAICRSEETAAVHRAFDRSGSAGRTALRKAMGKSGIDPPDLDDFVWSSVMRTEEFQARSIVGSALEEAIFVGRLVVGAKGWRVIQVDVCTEVLNSDHPDIPGQSWRTAILTERIDQWVSSPQDRSPKLAAARADIANQLLHPIDLPSDVEQVVHPMMWLLDQWGDEQPLTQAGYLKPVFVQSLQTEPPWGNEITLDRPVKNELDDHVLLDLREWLQHAGALRKHKGTLRRTPFGRKIRTDSKVAWNVLIGTFVSGGAWEQFVAETGLLFLLLRDDTVALDSIPVFVRDVAIDTGWNTVSNGHKESPSLREVSWVFNDVCRIWSYCELFETIGDWGKRQARLTEAGKIAALSYLRSVAAGPKDSPW